MSQLPFVLCADDFALSTGSSLGIISLLEKSRLSAVSCVVNTSLWPEQSQKLLPFLDRVDVGLHFNLTEGSWVSNPGIHNIGLKQLILKAYTHRLSIKLIMQELLAQIRSFTQMTGQTPNFIDGHQHIQQLPGVRQAILSWFTTQLDNNKTYLRCSYLSHLSGNNTIKRWMINRLGAKSLRAQLTKSSIRYNKTFSGVYDFSPQANYRKLFQHFLSETNYQGIIMCHPAKGFDAEDPHTLARQKEWQYLISDDFVDDCLAADMMLSRGYFLSYD